MVLFVSVVNCLIEHTDIVDSAAAGVAVDDTVQLKSQV